MITPDLVNVRLEISREEIVVEHNALSRAKGAKVASFRVGHN